jgi:carbon-monoxide dehydrogenase medium subunit
MTEFTYVEPETLEGALENLSGDPDATHLIAGGTAMVLLLKQGLIRPERVVGLRRVDALRGIRRTADGGLEIRAMATHRDAQASADVMAYCPALAGTFGSVATIRIRNQGTVGGNIAHADPAQDPPTMLLALGAEVDLASARGVRTIAMDALYVDYFETVIAADEVLVAVRLPALDKGVVVAYEKFLPRTRDDYATVALAVALDRGPDGACRDLRIGCGGVGPTVVRARSVEAALRGQHLSLAVIADAVALLDGDIDPIEDGRGSVAYKRDMARVWLRRTIQRLAAA